MRVIFADIGGGELVWLSATLPESEMPPGTRPLFIVDPDGRARVANQDTVRAVRHGNQEATWVLCVAPRVPPGEPAT